MFRNYEQYAALVLILGLILLTAGYVWLVGRGFRLKVGWGLALLAPPWIPQAIWFAARHRRSARAPFVVMFVGVLLLAVPYVLNVVNRAYGALEPFEQVVSGERHLTLTGWARTDYAGTIRSRPDVVVLQMANPDVDDATLEALEGLERLRELDLNGTAITDAGLAAVARLPALESLRLADTAIMDGGFREHLFQLERLRELDLRRTAVKSATVREWRKGRPERKALTGGVPRSPDRSETGSAAVVEETVRESAGQSP
ncbi:MAG: hypothetical protein KatS3mg108_2456 [Isosphaeraceae bacterium]|jgi:hypothetical protein|nr:MAG: hypothetical protein KatS3mg108_2456 [Isosphaeraceae bacterium]